MHAIELHLVGWDSVLLPAIHRQPPVDPRFERHIRFDHVHRQRLPVERIELVTERMNAVHGSVNLQAVTVNAD